MKTQTRPCPPIRAKLVRRALARYLAVGSLVVLQSGCSCLPMISAEYGDPAAQMRPVFYTQPFPIPPRHGLFPYGSAVSCPQVSVGRGMARCQ